MRLEKRIYKKLKSYTAVAGSAVMAATSAKADIVYTDVNPDETITDGSPFSFDLNGDAINDFTAQISFNSFGGSSSYVGYLTPLNANAVAYNNTFNPPFGPDYFVSALSSGSAISAGLAWGAAYTQLGFEWTSGTGPFNYGNFANAGDKYVGLRLNVSGNIHYGWLRVNIDANYTSGLVKDFAYNDVADAPINAGQMPILADVATTVSATDNADNGNASDMLVTFNKAADESNIGEYRVIVVPSASAGSFNVTSARNVASGNYTAVAKTGSNLSLSLDANAKTFNGGNIVLGTAYKVFVLSTPAGSATNHQLSSGSNEVVLYITAEVASNLIASDISDNNNPTDFQFSFDKIIKEETIESYSVFIVKSSKSDDFNLSQANSNLYGINILPSGENVSQVLPVTAKDTDGELILPETQYKFFVLSVGKTGVINSLTAASNEIILADNTIQTNEKISVDIKIYSENNVLKINSKHGIKEIKIISVSGELVANFNADDCQNYIDISKLKSGIYVLVISLNNEFDVIKKIIK